MKKIRKPYTKEVWVDSAADDGISEGVKSLVLSPIEPRQLDKKYLEHFGQVYNPNLKRLNPFMWNLAIVDLVIGLRKGECPSIKEVLRPTIESFRDNREEEVEAELDSYSEEQWDKLLNLCEVYFLKYIKDLALFGTNLILDDHFEYLGWMEHSSERFNEVMKYLGVTVKPKEEKE